jgi:septum formation protein
MIVLASGSSTRAALLKRAGVAFEQCPVDFDEDSLTYNTPEAFVYHATLGKLERYLALYGLSKPVLVADTVVACQGEILRKARSKKEARTILELQSGNKVSILTCMMYQTPRIMLIDHSITHYHFAPFASEALEAYLQTDEWKGKAGACMVEGFCKPYIIKVEGFESTAMGLCVEKLSPFLEEW